MSCSVSGNSISDASIENTVTTHSSKRHSRYVGDILGLGVVDGARILEVGGVVRAGVV